jgi:hypothetical protein
MILADVITVLGATSSAQIGFTSMHEHILLDLRVWKYKNEHLIPPALLPLGDDPVRLDNVGLLNRNNFIVTDNKLLDDEAVMTAEVADFKRGGDTILDLSSRGIRLDVADYGMTNQIYFCKANSDESDLPTGNNWTPLDQADGAALVHNPPNEFDYLSI